MVRRVRPESALAAFTALFAAACADRTPVAPTVDARPSLGLVGPVGAASAGRYLVGFSAPTTTLPTAVLAASGGRVAGTIPAFNVVIVDGVTNPTALKQAAPAYIEAEFETTSDVLTVPPNPSEVMESGAAEPNPATSAWYTSNVQWDIKAIKADEAWAISGKGAGVKICIVDSGIDDQHQEIAGKVLARANFVTSPASQTAPGLVDDLHGHGTHVSGEAAGRGVVTSGVAPSASLLGARVLNSSNSGSETAIVNGIKWCADQGAHVMNVSIGGIRYLGTTSFVTSPQTYFAALNYAYNKGVVAVVSAGNSNLAIPNPGGMQITVPAQVPGTIIVGATGPFTKIPRNAIPSWNPFDPAQVWLSPDGKAFYSNYGPGVHLFAPGGVGGAPLSYTKWIVNRVVQGSALDNIYGPCARNGTQVGVTNVGGVPTGPSASCAGQANRYVAFAGTSMAAPHVSGVAALLYGEIGGAPTLAKRQRVINCLKTTTDNIGPATIFGGGRVNAKKAIAALKANAC